MALSDDEQRLLDQMEAALAAEDPKLASTLRGRDRQWQHRRLVFAGLGFLVGIGILIGGMELHPALSVAGFVIMLAAAVVAVTSWQRTAMDADVAAGGARSGTERDFMSRMEERWRKQQDEGF